MFNSRVSCIIYLDTARFDFYVGGAENILRFDFSPAASNLEIKNHDELAVQIKAFVEANKIPLSNIAIVLSENILFVKTISATEDRELEAKRFVENIPFEHVSHKIYPIENGALIVAVNRDFYRSIQTAFEKLGFSAATVVPVFTTGVTTINPESGLDLASAKNLLTLYENLRQNNLELKYHEKIPPPHSVVSQRTESVMPKKNSNKRAVMLAGVFGLLIVILIVMLVTNNSPAPSRPAAPTPQAIQLNPRLKPEKIVLGASTSALNEKTIQIVITTARPSAQAAIIKQSLAAQGYKNISVITIPSQITSNAASSPILPSVFFSSQVQPSLRKQIFSIINSSIRVSYSSVIYSLAADVVISL